MFPTKKVPNSFLENINMVNTATTYFKSNQDMSNTNTFYNKNPNYISFSKNINFNTTYKPNALNINRISIEKNKLNQKKKFGWKDIMDLNYNEFKNDEKILDNPIVKNILNSDINENEIQNVPENYIVNLIHTLQGLANNAIKNNNNLELENKKLYHDLEEMKNNNEYLHQNNIKINAKLLNLNKQHNEEKKYYDLFNVNNPYINNQYKKKYYCHICTNKKFKSQYYLDEHINRRHPDYSQKELKKKTNKENKINIELYQKKINDMKKYFDALIYKSIKKIQYIKINEKLNSLQNLFDIIKLNTNNFINNINYIDINNNYKEEEIEYNKIDSIDNIDNIEEKEKKIEVENSTNLDKTEENSKKKQEEEQKSIELIKQNEMNEKKYANYVHTYLLLKKTIKFINIKKFFERKLEDPNTQQRRKKKHKTLKNVSNLIVTEMKKTHTHEEKILDEKKELNILKHKNENIDYINNKNDNNKIDEKDKIDIDIENKLKTNNEENLKQKLKTEEKTFNFSEEEEEEEEDKNQILKKFFINFRERDGKLCADKKYYKKNVLPEDYEINEEKTEKTIEEKINSKTKNIKFEDKSVQQMRTEMMRIYYETFDFKDKLGDMYLYSYLNISDYMNLKDLIFDANNNNFYLEDNIFQTINYHINETPDYNSNDLNNEQNEDNQGDFSFRGKI